MNVYAIKYKRLHIVPLMRLSRVRKYVLFLHCFYTIFTSFTLVFTRLHSEHSSKKNKRKGKAEVFDQTRLQIRKGTSKVVPAPHYATTRDARSDMAGMSVKQLRGLLKQIIQYTILQCY